VFAARNTAATAQGIPAIAVPVIDSRKATTLQERGFRGALRLVGYRTELPSPAAPLLAVQLQSHNSTAHYIHAAFIVHPISYKTVGPR